MKVLVTGHCGFVGTHLCVRLHKRNIDVIGLDLKEGNDILYCDLPDADRVYHLAAQTNAQDTDAIHDARTNIMGSLRIFKRYGDRVVHASSSMVNYPVTPYAISKKAAEDYARLFGAGIVRFCNLWGDGGHSVIDVFDRAEVLDIRGSGEQLRTYAPVHKAVEALLYARPGQLVILPGVDGTVNYIATMFPWKQRVYSPALASDLLDGRQL